jgi:hypothetical protein
MNAKQYRDAIEHLGLNQTSAAKLLGIDVRTSRRYALGECPVPPTVQKLLEIMQNGWHVPEKTGRPVRRK